MQVLRNPVSCHQPMRASQIVPRGEKSSKRMKRMSLDSHFFAALPRAKLVTSHTPQTSVLGDANDDDVAQDNWFLQIRTKSGSYLTGRPTRYADYRDMLGVEIGAAHVGPRAVVGRRLVSVDPDAGTSGPHDEMPAYTPPRGIRHGRRVVVLPLLWGP